MTLESGTRLGSYEVISYLRSGGMGDVYLAKDLKLGRQVVVKVIREEVNADATRLRRFIQEAKTASALNHPNIVTIYDIGTEGARHYIAMEYVDGKTIRQLLDAGPFSLEEMLHVATQVADGLAKAHTSGIVHRDLKPANLMVTQDGYAKILDFGLAKLLAPEIPSASRPRVPTRESRETLPGALLGTVGYVSPEQARGLPADYPADQFSFGTILYEMATGRRAFRRETVVQTLTAIIESEPKSITSLNPNLPAQLRVVVDRCLAKEPAERYSSTLDLARELKAVQKLLRDKPFEPQAKLSTASHKADVASRARASAGNSEDMAITPMAPRPALPTILVLPFDTLPANSEDDYFSDGLTDEIITDLSGLQGLRVISRTSAKQLKGTTKDIKALGRDLNVQYVLEGNVRKSGNLLRITSQLVDTRTDALRWASKYRGSLEDVFDIQEKISRMIVNALELKLSPSEEERLAERPISDVQAFEFYLRAKQEVIRFTKDGLERALEYLQKGIDLIGENILLHSAMGYVYWQYVNAGVSGDRAYLEKARERAEKILAMDPESPHGHRLLGLIGMHGGSSEEAARHLKRALAQDPNDTDTLLWMTLMYGFRGKPAAGYPLAERLCRIDPLTPFYRMLPGFLALMEGRFEAAVEPFLTAHKMDPGNPIVLLTYGQILAMNGRVDEAYASFDLVTENMPDSFFANLGRFYKLALQGQKKAALATLTEELEKTATEDLQYSWSMAHCFTLIGEKDKAIDWLTNAVDQGFFNYPLLSQLDPFLESLRNEEGFGELMKEVRRQWEAFDS